MIPLAQRIIALQAMLQAGSLGQSSSQQGIDAAAISLVNADAGCDIAVARTATARASERIKRATLPITARSLKSAISANRFVVNFT
jgi:hypothetical protein